MFYTRHTHSWQQEGRHKSLSMPDTHILGDKKPGTNPLSSNIPTLLAPNHLLHSIAMENPECEMAPAMLKWKKERQQNQEKKKTLKKKI
jgi:hypothetical protein